MNKSNNEHNENVQNKQENHPKNLVVSLLIISILASITTSYFFTKDISKNVIDWYLAIEYKKSWGKENYELINEAQRLQLEWQLPQIREFVKKGGTQNPKAPAKDTANSVNSKISQDEISSIKKTWFIEWSKDAKITLIEYSDLECPFCIRQYKEWTIKKIREKYGDKVNTMFKNFRWVAHENSEIEASAVLCVGDIGWTEKYAQYYWKIFERTTGNGTWFAKDNLIPLAKEIWMDEKKVQECLDSKKNIAKFDAETEEWKKLGVSWTPWTVIINNETGEYELVSGAYPVSEFERVIDKLLK